MARRTTPWTPILILLAATAWLAAGACILPAMPPTGDDDDDDASADDDDVGDDDTGDDDTGDDDTGDDDTGDDDTGDDDTGDDDTTGDDDDSTPPTQGDVTQTAILIPNPGTYTGDTTPMNDDYSDPTNCTGREATGNDVVYKLPLQPNQTLEVLVEYDQDLQDASLYISDDPASPDVNCDGGVDAEYDNGMELLTFTAVDGGMYFLVIDGYYAGTGAPFTMDVSF